MGISPDIILLVSSSDHSPKSGGSRAGNRSTISEVIMELTSIDENGVTIVEGQPDQAFMSSVKMSIA
jgi:hypothetical protein